MRSSVVLSYMTMKGGVGKTTLAANITRAMADITPPKPAGAPTKYLLIDADSQCNLTQIFMSAVEIDSRSGRSIYQAFTASHRLYGPSDLKTTVYQNKTNNSIIDLIPGSFEAFALNVAIPAHQSAAADVFSTFMEAARREYDFVIIDTNPSATFTTLQALAVSDFLVAPITFDAFSLRGIDLIVRTLQERYPWLADPQRVRIIPNKIVRARDEGTRTRQLDDEEEVINSFKNLEESISLSRIHESNFLDNRLARRGHGFVVDQRVFPMHRQALRRVSDDFNDVARGLNAAIRDVFEHEAQNKSHPVGPVRKALSGFLDRVTLGH